MRKLYRTCVGTLALVAMQLMTAKSAFAAWSGVDETVVERYAEEAGRPAWTPFINTDQGDILLFVFLLAGLIGGFIIGYYWRALFAERKQGINPVSREPQ